MTFSGQTARQLEYAHSTGRESDGENDVNAFFQFHARYYVSTALTPKKIASLCTLHFLISTKKRSILNRCSASRTLLTGVALGDFKWKGSQAYNAGLH